MNHIICSHKITEEIEQNLINLGVTPVKLRGIDKFGEIHPLFYHPDMFCFNVEKRRAVSDSQTWIFYDAVYKINKNIIDKLNFDVIITKNPTSCEYPNNVELNAAMFGNNLICNVKYTNKKIIEYAKKTGKNIIDVNQGYAKCSVCIVDENSIITSDDSIYKKAVQNNINVLLIEKGHIDLAGYDYGFIGGCSGLITSVCSDSSTARTPNGVRLWRRALLAFTGDIKFHPDYENIKSFCDNRGVEIISLSNKKLYDYGSLFKL